VRDELSTYGLGAFESPPDERDYPLSALYASESACKKVSLAGARGIAPP
jgi:hypothetical protein